jgi:hypothetical protein
MRTPPAMIMALLLLALATGCARQPNAEDYCNAHTAEMRSTIDGTYGDTYCPNYAPASLADCVAGSRGARIILYPNANITPNTVWMMDLHCGTDPNNASSVQCTGLFPNHLLTRPTDQRMFDIMVFFNNTPRLNITDQDVFHLQVLNFSCIQPIRAY